MKFCNLNFIPAITDGDEYSVVPENKRVSVLRYHDKPVPQIAKHLYTKNVNSDIIFS
jgi:hypothetical protein